ncbi:MAG TPA: enoyl-CoA hydratase/isomerase family protein, partial [Bacteroidales bacterium]|nr:enoyl-CoA hydratase/isomerase family protein [Bacteroidales bacterium]
MENKVLYEVNGRIGYITLNRPEKRNALNEEMVKMLKDAFTKAEKDDAVKVIVLRAQGDTFCAGADLAYLKQLQKYSYEENLADSHNLMTLFKQIYIHPKVVIAQVEGHAIAGGGGLAAVCDFVFSVPEAKFGFTEVKIGFIPAIISVFIIRKLGEAVAKYLLLTGKLFDAKIMKNYFLVNEIVDRKNIADFVEKFAQNLCTTTSAQSLTNTKRLIADVQNLSFQEGLMYSAKLNAESRGNDDCKRGIEKF